MARPLSPIDEATGALDPDPNRSLVVATTRPETILGDTAVAVHPDDERYRDLVGRRVRIPFVDRDVPIIADEVVDRAFGTGAVKITPAHDQDDYETGKRHGLPAPTILADDATVANTGTEFDGLDRYEARRRIVAALTERGDLVEERVHEMVVGRCQRSDDVLEPRLKTQWFIRTEPLAARALEATRSGRTRILPERFEKTWEQWLTNIHDWNVSRQLWWGHRIPAWYCPDGHVTVSSDPAGPRACEVCGRGASELEQDPDIFDTWFSSGLWPFSTLGWPDDTPDYERYHPTSVMETGYDIIFFWVARMVMLGIHLTGTEPFHTVYLSGLIRDPEGKKMSKTKGNVVDPLGVIDETGADALRFAVIHGATAGQDQRFSAAKLENARNFANKLWNATRFVAGARPRRSRRRGATHARRAPPRPAERWILSRAAATVEAVDGAMADYAFGEVTRVLYDAIWNEFCDWGVELAKVRLADDRSPTRFARRPGGRSSRRSTRTCACSTRSCRSSPKRCGRRFPHRARDPELLIVARWPAPRSGTPWPSRRSSALIGLVGDLRNARATASSRPRRGWRRASTCRWTRDDVRGPPAGDRADGPRATPPPRADARGARRGPGAGRPHGRRRAPARSRPPSGPTRSMTAPAPSNAPGSSASWPRPRAGWRPPASGSPTRRSCPGPAGGGRGRASA